MISTDFFSIYLPALKKALNNDGNNTGFHVLGPDYFFPKNLLYEMDAFITYSTEYAEFFNRVGDYFDAKSHYANEVRGVDIHSYKNQLFNEIEKLCFELRISDKN